MPTVVVSHIKPWLRSMRFLERPLPVPSATTSFVMVAKSGMGWRKVLSVRLLDTNEDDDEFDEVEVDADRLVDDAEVDVAGCGGPELSLFLPFFGAPSVRTLEGLNRECEASIIATRWPVINRQSTACLEQK